MISRQVDPKGRITLDKAYAGSTMLVEQREDGTILLHPAVTVPAREAWLWKNQKALQMVMEGISQARAGEHAEPPDLAAVDELLDERD